ncbi:hypothetical protein RIF29_15881 [Crotalaria pallida]|uniref:YdbS-like PH domain-containing protein n=1 Tax=Crotalaria pallida TaxID=3830 RepID=A0AAN9FE23_CROPI
MKFGAVGLPSYRTFTLEEIDEATKNFNTGSFMGEGSKGLLKTHMASTPLLSPPTTTTTTVSHHTLHPTPTSLSLFFKSPPHRRATRLHVSSPTNKPTTSATTATTTQKPAGETVFFDGGAHYGDLLANLVLGFTLLWLPLTLAAVSRAFYLRYRFTNLRVTVISGFTGQDRSDFSYNVIKDVQVVPRFIGEWGDVIITLKDGTKVDLRSVPKFREIAKYCTDMAQNSSVEKETGPKGF